MAEINFFAETTFRNQRKKFGIKTDDRRRHVYVIGKTGMGKTVLLKNMAIQDIRQGKGVGFVDPHGEAAEELLDFIPSKRVNDVVYFNPADIDYPVAFNIMEKVRMEDRHLVASGLMGVFKKIWPDVWSARMEYILNNSILALLEYPDSTLLGVNRMLSDVDYRKKVVDKVSDPVVKSFWVQEFARYTQRYEVEATAAIQNKVGQFISNPLIRNIIGQVKSSIDMREIMDGKKILILNLSKGRIGEDNSRLLGALLITKLQLAAMSRIDTPEEKRQDFFLYVDEFQNFATESFANILSEARKYRLALLLGHQYVAQMEDKVRDAVFGNVGTIISFRVGAEDAEYLEKEFSPEFTAEDIVNLGKYNIYLKLMIDGIAGSAFSAETLPPLEKQEQSNREKIIKVSRERYGVTRAIIEDKISRWTGILTMPERPAQPTQPTQTLYDAKCSNCGRDIKVIFPPEPNRPVYCKSCLKKIRGGKGEKEPVPTRLPKAPTISLSEALEKEPISFSFKKLPKQEDKKPKRKEIDLEGLKQTLRQSLKSVEDKNEEEKNKQNIPIKKIVKTVNNFNFKDKKVLVRVDYNVAMDDQNNVIEDFRITSTLPTINYLIKSGAKIILMSHLGDPEGQIIENLRLKPVAKRLSELINRPVMMAPDCVGPEVEKMVKEIKSGDILLLENLRFHPEEQKKDDNFVRKLARLGDIYINDAFAVCHRDHASITGIPKYLPSGAGLLLEKEIRTLRKFMENPERPVISIIGGKKVETKSKLINKISEFSDFVFIGGLISKEIKEKNIAVTHPEKLIAPLDEVGEGKDIGPKTIEFFREKAKIAKTIFWNGPLGRTEDEQFSKGTEAFARIIIESNAFSIIGGGETIEFLDKLHLLSKFKYVSSGGGAMLAFLSGDPLPGIEALK